jgi:hypothetical protein
MRIRTVTVAALVAATAVIVPATSAAAAAETSPEIAWVNDNVIVTGADPTTAYIQAKYSCEGEGVHLWTSVKQGPNIDEEHTTSDFAVSWYETPEGPVPNCDGKTHVTRFAVSLADGFDPLVSGDAWVQFVFFYINTEGVFTRAADVGWATVQAPTGR